MAEPNYVTIGRTRKAHGLTGELKVSIEERFLEDFLKCERIFIDVKGAKIPYFIENVRGGGDIILHLEEVSDRDAAIALQSRDILLREQDILPDHLREFEPEEEDVLAYGFVEGYTLVDQSLGRIGIIKEVLEMPQQEMAFLDYKNAEVLIPLNEQLIISINEEKREILMDLPEGLLD
ncbi:MAG TPA: ribosome maturation factor RimM [Saprospiraceae bacterium]|nr:ribosome maturation factor RimM [Saprospiraceae bacterium]